MRLSLPSILFLSAFAVRLAGLGSESFWYDEAFSAHMASLSFHQLIPATSGDVHPPAWYLISWLFARLGDSEFVLRLPAALFSAAGCREMYLVVLRASQIAGFKQKQGHFGQVEHAALAAALIMLASGGMQYYGQEARMYSLLTWLILLAVRALMENNRALLAPALALTLYSQNLGALYVAPIAALALWRWRRRAILPLSAAALAYLPWTSILLHQAADVGGGFWIPPNRLGGVFHYLFFGTFGPRTPDWAQAHAMAAALALTILALYALRDCLRPLLPIIVIAIVPAVALFLISQIWRPLLLPRALLPASAGVIALWGLGLARMRRSGQAVSYTLLVPMLLLSASNYYHSDAKRMDLRTQTDIIRERWMDGDAIYHVNLASAITIGYYLEDYPHFLIPEVGDLSQSLSESTKSVMGLKQREMSAEAVRAAGYQRLWLIWVESPVISDFEIDEANRIITTYRVAGHWQLARTKLTHTSIYLVYLEDQHE